MPPFHSPALTLARQTVLMPDGVAQPRSLFAAKFEAAGALLVAMFLFCAQIPLQAQTQTPVTTYHYDNARTGANTTETILTPANVKYQTFGQLWSKPIDGLMVGHPLYLPNVTIPGKGARNVLFAATMHDSVYAFDADNPDPTPLWMTSLLDQSPAGATSMPATLKKNGNATGWTELGIVSTPVIDSTTGTIFLVAETFENGNVAHRLHALDVTTGLEKFGGPVTIAATVLQNGVSTPFQDFYQMNRPGLLLANGHVYIGWGSNGSETLPCQGWVFSYNATTLAQEGVYTPEPGGTLGSIWMEGAGISADSDGNIYAENGEGDFLNGVNLSTSVLKLSQVGTTLSLADYFTPFMHQFLSAQDLDLTGAVLILPDQMGSFPHEAVGIGKQGTIYVVNRDNLGQLCSDCTTVDTQIVQELPLAVPNSGSPVYWNNTVYFTGLGVPVVGYPLDNGQLGTPFSAPSVRGAGANPVLTANGSTNGILWFVDGNHDLWALDATNLTMLYASGQAANNRDKLPVLAHFASPIAADGKVFIGTVNSVVGFGLLSSIVPDFGVSASVPTPGSISAGQSSTLSIDLSPYYGFTGSVALTCSVTPQVQLGPQCSISPSSIAPGTTATLTVTTTAPTTAEVIPQGRFLKAYALALPILGLALTGFGSRRRKTTRIIALISLLLVVLVLQPACGGGGGSMQKGGGSSGTPAGQYTISITGTSGSLGHTSSVVVSVQ